jgi:hypothetical protein
VARSASPPKEPARAGARAGDFPDDAGVPVFVVDGGSAVGADPGPPYGELGPGVKLVRNPDDVVVTCPEVVVLCPEVVVAIVEFCSVAPVVGMEKVLKVVVLTPEDPVGKVAFAKDPFARAGLPKVEFCKVGFEVMFSGCCTVSGVDVLDVRFPDVLDVRFPGIAELGFGGIADVTFTGSVDVRFAGRLDGISEPISVGSVCGRVAVGAPSTEVILAGVG